MSKRDSALKWIRVASYHGDDTSATRLYLENRISRAAFNRAMNEGRKLKEEGAPCSCSRCVN